MEEYVLKGVALLDSKLPGWEEHVNWYELNIWELHRCVIGQLDKHYGEGETFKAVGLQSWREGRQYGLDVPPDSSCQDYIVLTKAWQDWARHHRMHV